MSNHSATPTGAVKHRDRVLSQKPLNRHQGQSPAEWDKLHNYVHPGTVTLRLAIFWTSNVKDENDPMPDYFSKAQGLLKQHGLNLQAYPATTKDPATTLQFNEEVTLRTQAMELRQKAHAAFPGDNYSRLPVIVCPLRQSTIGEEANGMVIIDRPDEPSDWLPFVLINSKAKSPDRVTLLHEIGHAAGLVHPGAVGKDAAIINFMQYYDPATTNLPGREGILHNQVKKLAVAYFASPK
ncbi:hypothetical protein H6G33_12085 [Calothrix sp. FACHB-1219]|uniref:hypothetical protein n=1 Tax=unclassified Calothrix TaxID=2619626 RepID=UPI001689BF87|nr:MULTISPECIES: hypothetical protein [unclassified Calothrix]MBD2202365.1 hypothetical protein [Calothrix sp. FACHB-168]MBD2217771.1 hypothetical protein [Calothrix sp. FACHB-1219]